MSKPYLIIILVVLILGAALFATTQPAAVSFFDKTVEKSKNTDEDAVVFVTDEGHEVVETDQQAANKTNKAVEEVTASDEQEESPYLPLKEHMLGDADAPVTIHEFSSLSCGHCGAFHTDTYPTLVKEYIDTGKARLVLIDFPTNLPALEGAMLAHCLPQDKYIDFIKTLFETQQAWLSGNYKENLITEAEQAGLSREEAQACLNDAQLKEAILKRTEESSSQLGIHSTPSFLFNSGEAQIIGNKPYDEFKQTLEGLLTPENSDGGAEN